MRASVELKGSNETKRVEEKKLHTHLYVKKNKNTAFAFIRCVNYYSANKGGLLV